MAIAIVFFINHTSFFMASVWYWDIGSLFFWRFELNHRRIRHLFSCFTLLYILKYFQMSNCNEFKFYLAIPMLAVQLALQLALQLAVQPPSPELKRSFSRGVKRSSQLATEKKQDPRSRSRRASSICFNHSPRRDRPRKAGSIGLGWAPRVIPIASLLAWPTRFVARGSVSRSRRLPGCSRR